MKWVSQYLNLAHRSFFEHKSLAEPLAEIEKTLDQRDIKDQWVFLSHSDPVMFALSFLSILDRGGAPVALAHGNSLSHLDSWGLIENNWSTQTPARPIEGQATQSKMGLYAVPTSGTTGHPKLCEFSFERALQNARAHAHGFGLESQHEVIQTLPVHHSYGIIAYILTPLVVRSSVNFCPGMMGLRTLRKKQDQVSPQSVIHISPSQARFILNDGVSIENLRKVTIGGGSVSILELEQLQKLLPKADIYVSYGLTEAGPRVTAGKFFASMKTDMLLEGSEAWIGRPLIGVDVSLSTSELSSVETEINVGRLCIQSPFLKINPEPGEIIGGRLVTRDRVRLIGTDIFFLSREDDLIKYGGVTIYPKDIEILVRKWPGVTDVIVLKEEDKIYGDVAILALEGDINIDEAQKLLNNEYHLATAFKKIFVQNLFPRQSLEKIDRKKLLAAIRSTET